MKTLLLGHSGLQVSEVCLGILPYGTGVDERTSFALLDAYYEAGGHFIDTANNYSKWHAGGTGVESETTLGKWLKARGNRAELVIATKVGFNRNDIGESLSAQTIRTELEGSLKRMGIEYVDVFYAHADIRRDPLEATLETFDAQLRAGKARALGCSNYLAWRIERARSLSRSRGWTEYCCVQQRHTYLRPQPGAGFGGQRSSNDDLLDYCRENRDIRMLAYSPLLQGAYTRSDRPVPSQYAGKDTEDRLRVLREVAAETGMTANQVVYAWMNQQDPAVIPLTAPTSLEQLRENLGFLGHRLSVEQMERLTGAGTPKA